MRIAGELAAAAVQGMAMHPHDQMRGGDQPIRSLGVSQEGRGRPPEPEGRGPRPLLEAEAAVEVAGPRPIAIENCLAERIDAVVPREREKQGGVAVERPPGPSIVLAAGSRACQWLAASSRDRAANDSAPSPPS